MSKTKLKKHEKLIKAENTILILFKTKKINLTAFLKI